MALKKFFLQLFYFGNSSRSDIDRYQRRIRDVEWAAISSYIPKNTSFLDVGCGAGYSMKLAYDTRNCIVQGVDAEPFRHGVGRAWEASDVPAGQENAFRILQGVGEALPYEDKSFDVVYSSHVLEHANNELQFLKEAERVMKDTGVLIIGMPTASMAVINLLSNILFTTHQRWLNFFMSRLGIGSAPRVAFINLFIPASHSFSDRTLFYDFKHYRVSKWQATIAGVFDIQKVILPALYPYPDYLQWFPFSSSGRFSSSVFFICKKRSAR
jgi:ubiquinone/menaquinone biosynthesis C-methylase UbiE